MTTPSTGPLSPEETEELLKTTKSWEEQAAQSRQLGPSAVEKILSRMPTGKPLDKAREPVDEIELAKAIAIKAHVGQFRRDGVTPYITHPEAVAAAVSDEFKAVAWLHDVLEDTDFTAADLAALGVPSDVIDAVVVLTKPKGDLYADYVDRVAQNELAKTVKLADNKHNMGDDPSPKQAAKYAYALKRLQS
jgi:(p)ppGpp synthase/HD superfamily hydrolase